MRCNDECGAGRIRNSCTISNGCEKNVLFIKAYTLNIYHNRRLCIVALEVYKFQISSVFLSIRLIYQRSAYRITKYEYKINLINHLE